MKYSGTRARSRAVRRGLAPAAVVGTALAVGLAAAPPAFAAPARSGLPAGWTVTQSTIPAGVTDGAQLAIDSGRRLVYIADGDDYKYKEPTTGQVLTYPHPLDPKVSVVNVDSRKVVRGISYAKLPTAPYRLGPAVIQMQQIPTGLAVDTTRGLVMTTNSETSASTIVNQAARVATPRDMVSAKLAHPMGIAADSATGQAYIANVGLDSVAVIDSKTRKQKGSITGLFRPSMLAVDSARHRLYIGNADTQTKKRNFLTVVDTTTNRVITKIPTAPNSRPTVDPATGNVYAVSFQTGEIAVIDGGSYAVTTRIATKTSPNNLAIDAQRRIGYTSNLFRKSITVIDLTKNTVIGTIPTKAATHTIAVDQRTGTAFASQFQSPNLTVVRAARK
ncbi:YncE family protein [Gordonia sp. FQ]|uniref:YncE family protein n=1 Tax=Gordonia sp. FQ TaxID=3446634 RepID=UPI003F835C8B